jgi:signal transduction histidine kinase
MTRRLLATYVTITALALAVLAVPLGLTFAQRERDRLFFDIERDAIVIASLAEDDLESDVTPDLDAVLADYRAATTGRVVVVDRAGISVADSDGPDTPPRDYSTRPEIGDALEGRRAIGTRRSATLDENLVFVAIPVASGGAVHGAVRITFPTRARDARVRDVWLRLGLLSAAVLALVACVGFVLARGVTRPLRAVEGAAERIAAGDLAARVPADRGPREVRTLAATFNRTAARLDQLVGSQQRFVADAAHQLRTPLTALRLRLENLEPHLPPDQGPKLEAAIGEVQRLGHIVAGLLLLARQDAEAPANTAVDLGPVVADRLAVWADVAGEQDVDLRGGLPEHLWVGAPAGAVEQILDNLLSNALGVTPPSGTIAVTVLPARGHGELHVVDQGPGLDADARERAFERFWRSDGGSGSGLGLAIVRQLARAAGGDARLQPGPGGRGLDAVVELPLLGPPAEERATFTDR